MMQRVQTQMRKRYGVSGNERTLQCIPFLRVHRIGRSVRSRVFRSLFRIDRSSPLIKARKNLRLAHSFLVSSLKPKNNALLCLSTPRLQRVIRHRKMVARDIIVSARITKAVTIAPQCFSLLRFSIFLSLLLL